MIAIWFQAFGRGIQDKKISRAYIRLS